ncbi:MAG: hypothetical protein Unbinned6284contig1004_27 [Prokaryotic dsDNA virus sp.]|nr:MAG: hypothetical protein Unbinned6284contig1004_27 [Prokaryotic dsDNA virus sp.]|tara:strand:- start:33494 stop:33781 length:288 start_codon:yes stop_codon:yes gene_type:complete
MREYVIITQEERKTHTYTTSRYGDQKKINLHDCMFDKLFVLIDENTGFIYKAPRTNKVACHSLNSARHMLSNQKHDNDLNLKIAELKIEVLRYID